MKKKFSQKKIACGILAFVVVGGAVMFFISGKSAEFLKQGSAIALESWGEVFGGGDGSQPVTAEVDFTTSTPADGTLVSSVDSSSTPSPDAASSIDKEQPSGGSEMPKKIGSGNRASVEFPENISAANPRFVVPATHIHFAMDTENADGSFAAKNPEPISGYTNIAEGKWYLSDNATPEGAQRAVRPGLADISAETGAGASSDVAEGPQESEVSVQLSSMPVPAEAPVGQSAIPEISDAVQSSTSSTADIAPAAIPSIVASATVPQLPSQTSSFPLSSSSGGSAPAAVSVAPSAGGVSATSPENGANAPDQTSSAPTSSSPSVPTSTASSSSPNDGDNGSVSSTPTSTASSSPFALAAPSPASGTDSVGSFNSSTFSIDLAWQSPQNASGSSPIVYNIFITSQNSSSSTLLATTTATSFSYAIADSDFGANDQFAVQAVDGAGDESALATTTIAIPAWLTTIQPFDGNDSRPSWYDDNWYDLGTGFFGTIRSFTLEGSINSDQYFSSQLNLEEFSDANYTVLDHTFPISSDAPFTQTTAKVTIDNLKIPLQPDKYYRLTTYQTYQNRSVILRGSDATGTAMWDNFVPGQGGIQYDYTFYPYISAIIVPEDLPIAPPSLFGSVAVAFDPADSVITASWPAASDPDEPLVPLAYEVNVSTSTVLNPASWQSVGTGFSAPINAIFPNAYTIGVRAVDDFGHASQPIMATWSFPDGYIPVPVQLDHSVVIFSAGVGAQKMTFVATTTATAVDFWTAPVGGIYCCSQTYLSIYKDNGGVEGDEIPSGNPVFTLSQYDSAGEVSYPFTSPITFSPGSYWFSIAIGPSDTTNPTNVYGSSGDAYSGGYWSTSPGRDAYFRIQVASP